MRRQRRLHLHAIHNKRYLNSLLRCLAWAREEIKTVARFSLCKLGPLKSKRHWGTCSLRTGKMGLRFQHTRQSWRFAILLFSLILYMCICALVFSSLEKENDRSQYDFYQGLKKSYKRKYNMSEQEFVKFVSDVNILYKRGYIHDYKNYWNFYHSFWFTTTVVTTMGMYQWIRAHKQLRCIKFEFRVGELRAERWDRKSVV